MTSLNTVKAQTLLTAGKTVGEIAKACKVRKAVVQEWIDSNAVKGQVVNAVVATEVTETNNKMQQMLAAAQKQEEVVETASKRTKTTVRKVEATKFVDSEGNKRQKRNTNLATRKACVMVCDVLKQAWVGAHIAFTTKTEAGMLQVVRNAPQKALSEMQASSTLRVAELSAEVALGNDLEQVKQELFDKYAAMGYTMVSRRAKLKEVAA